MVALEPGLSPGADAAVALHGSMRHHEEGSICCVPWGGEFFLHKAGSEQMQVCEQRQVQAVCAQSNPKTSGITVVGRPGLLQPT